MGESPNGKGNGGNGDDPWMAFAKFMGMGLEVAVAVILGLFVGNWLDDKFGRSPLFLFLGLIAGLAAAVNILIGYSRVAKRDQGNDKDKK